MRLALVGVIGVKSFSLSALRIIVEKVIVLDHHAGASGSIRNSVYGFWPMRLKRVIC